MRFGNVLGSTGSVVPLFKEQIAKGGPITVTDPEITRYFMTIKEASQLILQAGAQGIGGEIFVLDMGQPVKIVDLAKHLIKLSGKKITDVGIVFTGLRPGEKMYEELFYKQEGLIKTEQKKIFKANGESTMNWYDIQQAVISLEHYCLERNENKLMKKVSQILSSEVDCVEHLGVA